MKKIIFIAAIMFAACITASAQKAKSGEWSSAYVQYNPMTFVVDYQGSEDLDFTGFTVGYNKAFSIAGKTPLFITVGGELNAAFYSDSYQDEDVSDTYINVRVPALLTYKWNVSDNINILPYAGLYARIGIVANEKYEDEHDSETISLFDKKDMGSKDATWGRLQIGTQIGFNVEFNSKWYLGLSYSTDLSNVCKKCSFTTYAITAGLNI